MLILCLLMLFAIIGSALLTCLIRSYALKKSLLDIPNQRSSHTVPTPRGGGVAFVISFLVLLPFLYWLNFISITALIGFWGAGSIVAIIGFLDDRQHVAARWRLLTHFIAALWLLYWFSGFPTLLILGFSIPSMVTTLIAMFYLVWILNLYNFMDGINGIASIETITVCLSGAVLYYLAGYSSVSCIALILAGTVIGFLFWNFPVAKIFMGDAGSGFLGIILGGLSIQAAWISSQLFFAWLIVLGVFIVDATWTLIHRLLRKERLYEAHRSHSYQHAARYFGKHSIVTLAVLFINVIWLLPIASFVVSYDFNGFLALIVAYFPLCCIAFIFKAGSAKVP